jgi:WD40 repeat protein
VPAGLRIYLVRQAATVGRRPAPLPVARDPWVPHLQADDAWGCLGGIDAGGSERPAIALGSDDRRLFVGNGNGQVRCYDLTTGDVAWEASEHHSGTCNDLVLSPEGDRLASASNDQTIRVFDAETGRCLVVGRGHSRMVYGTTWSPDGRYLVSSAAASPDSMRLWDADTGDCLTHLRQYKDVSSGASRR